MMVNLPWRKQYQVLILSTCYVLSTGVLGLFCSGFWHKESNSPPHVCQAGTGLLSCIPGLSTVWSAGFTFPVQANNHAMRAMSIIREWGTWGTRSPYRLPHLNSPGPDSKRKWGAYVDAPQFSVGLWSVDLDCWVHWIETAGKLSGCLGLQSPCWRDPWMGY